MIRRIPSKRNGPPMSQESSIVMCVVNVISIVMSEISSTFDELCLN